MSGINTFSVPRGRYAAASWPAVVRCSTPGCVMRHRADTAAEPWVCDSHRDPYSDSGVGEVVADVLAESAHRELTEPTATSYDDPPRGRRYSPRPTRRLDRDWRPDDAA